MEKPSKIDFSLAVEERARSTGSSHIECCTELAEEYDLDVADIVSLITKTLREKIEMEAIERRTVKIKQPTTLDWMDD